ncbi:hypothetical protein DLM76_20655 [Leptospira yasudae]|nr:hypothetical protein DLM76_20655 [Leptospira yasudae]
MDKERIEFHIYKHFKPESGQRRLWGSTGQCFIGEDGDKVAILEAEKLQRLAPLGIEYSVQKYVYSITRKNRPSKTKIWRNGILLKVA